VTQIRRAGPEDAAAVAKLLHDFNTEYEDETPGIEVLTERFAALLGRDDFAVLLAGDGSDGFALLRFWDGYVIEHEAYLGELYVVPELRGQGMGKALLRAAIGLCRERGVGNVFLGTSEADAQARALYESEGFTSREGGGPDDPLMYVYERDL
jgi:ribosomal protein S18 acetylase RimI-like enzyme